MYVGLPIELPSFFHSRYLQQRTTSLNAILVS